MTGALFWFLERRDLYVRFHAAQACVVFGAIALVVALLSGIARRRCCSCRTPSVLGLDGGPDLVCADWFLWVVAIWHAATGRLWRIPVAAQIATGCALDQHESTPPTPPDWGWELGEVGSLEARASAAVVS